jgi:hypothetical protein
MPTLRTPHSDSLAAHRQRGSVFTTRWPALLFAAAIVTLVLVACRQVQQAGEPPVPPRSYKEVQALIGEVSIYDRRIGFRETENFRRFSDARRSFPFCGNAPRLYLPYSYEDPAIKWYEVETEDTCRAIDTEADVYFGHSEALGEIKVAVTPAMLSASLARLIYVVVHENCHDQFDLPYGIEEPLCNVIAYGSLPAFASEHYGLLRAEYYAVGLYANSASTFAHTTIRYYEELATLYAAHTKLGAGSERNVLRQRADIFKRASRALGWDKAEMNNVLLANAMTYSRHYPFVEEVFDALGRDVARMVAFFRAVDEARPKPEEVMQARGLTSAESVDYLRAYEGSVVETARKLLPGRCLSIQDSSRKDRTTCTKPVGLSSVTW